MTEDQIARKLAAKYGLTEREARLYYEIYWRKFVLEKMNLLEHDIVEVLKLGVFTPRFKVVKFLLRRFFWFRKELKKSYFYNEEIITKLNYTEDLLRRLSKLRNLFANKRIYGNYDRIKEKDRELKAAKKRMVLSSRKNKNTSIL